MEKTKVSVIVPCYNVGELITRLLDAFERQDYTNFEVIFVNDGSSDNTSKVITEFIRKASSINRYKLIDKENGGPGSARNAGLDVATGNFVLFIDGDDYIYPQALSKLVALMSDDVDVGVGAFVGHDGIVLKFPHIDDWEKWLQKTMTGGALTMWNKLFRRSIIENCHIRFDTKARKSEDHLFTAEYFVNCSRKIAVTDYPVYKYELNTMSLSNIASTTNVFSPWIADSVYMAVRIYGLFKPHVSASTLRELRYDTYHKYRRIRHEAHAMRYTDRAFYDNIYNELRKVIPLWEIPFLAIRRRASIITESLKRKVKKRLCSDIS